MKKNVHIISHSHWDREWYMPFEYHRFHLIELIDTCMKLFETDLDFRGFHLDGHTALLEDYLEIKPQSKEKLRQYVQEGKFAIGPWYVLQDEFLTSSEANIRNLLTGMQIAEEYGKVCHAGYFPDSFGNAGQMPQIMKQAGMRAIVFGRGVKPTGENNTVSDGGYESQFSEMFWESPDGSRLPAILFANWYNNGWEVPVDANEDYWLPKLAAVEKYAGTDELLMMNGCDHQPVQCDITEAIKNAEEKYPDYHFIHSDFETYMDALLPKMDESFTVVKGELISQDTDGWTTLVNTCSTMVDLKVANRKGEQLLENIAEPLACVAAQYGMEYPHDMLLYAWKTLMKNHPHDSICSCSCDEVNDEVRMRFQKSRQAAERIVEETLSYLAKKIDRTGFDDCDAVFAVFNPFGKPQTDTVCVNVDVERHYGYGDFMKHVQDIKSLPEESYELVDASGKVIACSVTKAEPRFGYDLPKDKFRQPYLAKQVMVSFEACDVPAMGYAVYGIRRVEKVKEKASLITGKHCMENELLRAQINPDGTVTLLDKKNDRIFSDLLRYEDVGDNGNEYIFAPVPGDMPILSGNTPAEIELIRDEEFCAEYKITTRMQIPAEADAKLSEERSVMMGLRHRQAKRGKELVELKLETYVSLEKNAKALKVRTAFTNPAKDHRLRVLIPTGIKTDVHKVESVFEAAQRNNEHKPTWTYPSGCEHQQGFVMLSDEQSGLAVANIGLYEYEVLKDRTLALTILRATGELGDWGVFPTKLSQCLRDFSLEYEIMPFGNEDEAFSEMAAYQYPMQSVQLLSESDGAYQNGQLVWTGEELRMTAFKKAQGGNNLILRWVNYSGKEQTLFVKKSAWISNLYRSNVLEQKLEELKESKDGWTVIVKPYEIITLGVEQ